MISRVLLKLALLSLFVPLIHSSESDEELQKVNDCRNNLNGSDSCRYILRWAVNVRLRANSFHSCNNYRDSLRSELAKFWPAVAGSSRIRFQKHGENCSQVAENNFYYELVKIAYSKPNYTISNEKFIANSSHIDPSPNSYMLRWGQKYFEVLQDIELRQQICEPRWLLTCKQDTCACITPDLLNDHEHEHEHAETDKDAAEHRELEKMSEAKVIQPGIDNEKLKANANLSDESYRCFLGKGEVCEIHYAFVGLCTTDCEEGQDCFLGYGVGEEENVKEPVQERRCCTTPKDRNRDPKHQRDCSTISRKKKSSARILQPIVNTLELCLIAGIIFCHFNVF